MADDISVTVGLVQGYLQFVPRAEIIPDVISPSVADVPFRVPHNLGEEPTFVSAIAEAACSVYATADDRLEWKADYVKIRCSVANLRMIVKVER